MSGGRLCALIGVPWHLSMLSTFSTHIGLRHSPHAEGANSDPLPEHAYEGTLATA